MQSDTTTKKTFDEYLAWRQGSRVRRTLGSGPLAPYWNDFIGTLIEREYSWRTILEGFAYWGHLSQYAQILGVDDASVLTADFIDEHIASRVQRGTLLDYRRQKALGYLALLVSFLRDCNVVAKSSTTTDQQPEVVVEYLKYLENHRGITTHVIREYGRRVMEFLDEVVNSPSTENIRQIEASAVSGHIAKRAETLGRGGTKALCAALRSFFRFLHLRGYVERNMKNAIPVVPCFKLDRLPEPTTEGDIEKILSVVDRRTAQGKRDFAILRVLATYGLRSCQICALCLDDIDWRACTLRIPPAKGGTENIVPLLPSVGEALIDYLRNGRPDWSFRQIFLRTRAPKGPIRCNIGGNVVKQYARKAGVRLHGSHAWRHGCATRLLAKGFPLKTIRDLLGHESIETTFIYTKVDIEKLRCAALDWPGELR